MGLRGVGVRDHQPLGPYLANYITLGGLDPLPGLYLMILDPIPQALAGLHAPLTDVEHGAVWIGERIHVKVLPRKHRWTFNYLLATGREARPCLLSRFTVATLLIFRHPLLLPDNLLDCLAPKPPLTADSKPLHNMLAGEALYASLVNPV